MPTDFSARIARNTQLILQEESHVTHTADPLAGSHSVEWLTDQLAQKAWTLIQEVEALGGMTKAIEAGLPKLRIEESAARRQAAIDSGQETIVRLTVTTTVPTTPHRPTSRRAPSRGTARWCWVDIAGIVSLLAAAVLALKR